MIHGGSEMFSIIAIMCSLGDPANCREMLVADGTARECSRAAAEEASRGMAMTVAGWRCIGEPSGPGLDGQAGWTGQNLYIEWRNRRY
jgi:hypothetical protein